VLIRREGGSSIGQQRSRQGGAASDRNKNRKGGAASGSTGIEGAAS